MAANFWLSSHWNQWMLDRDELAAERQKHLQFLSEEEYKKVNIFFANFIQALGEHLKVRQQVIATGTVYFRRFYARYILKEIDPLLMAPTCLFLAHKVEECGVLSNSRLIAACTHVMKTKYAHAFTHSEYPYRMPQVLECEFYLLEMMDCCLIVYHPYRPLSQYVSDLGEEASLLPVAWRIVNDTLRTDIVLIYPPYQVALAAIHMAAVIQQKDIKHWFAELSVDMDKILEITQEILNFYELWKSYDEKKEIGSIIMKVPKPKQNGSRPPSAASRHTPSPKPPSLN